MPCVLNLRPPGPSTATPASRRSAGRCLRTTAPCARSSSSAEPRPRCVLNTLCVFPSAVPGGATASAAIQSRLNADSMQHGEPQRRVLVTGGADLLEGDERRRTAAKAQGLAACAACLQVNIWVVYCWKHWGLRSAYSCNVRCLLAADQLSQADGGWLPRQRRDQVLRCPAHPAAAERRPPLVSQHLQVPKFGVPLRRG